MLGAIGVVVGTSPAVLIFIVPIAVAYYRIQRTYRMAAKEVRRRLGWRGGEVCLFGGVYSFFALPYS